jgi:hypothetical protein
MQQKPGSDSVCVIISLLLLSAGFQPRADVANFFATTPLGFTPTLLCRPLRLLCHDVLYLLSLVDFTRVPKIGGRVQAITDGEAPPIRFRIKPLSLTRAS